MTYLFFQLTHSFVRSLLRRVCSYWNLLNEEFTAWVYIAFPSSPYYSAIVCDHHLTYLARQWSNAHSINLSRFHSLTDDGLFFMAIESTRQLEWLDLSECYQLTDRTLEYLGRNIAHPRRRNKIEESRIEYSGLKCFKMNKNEHITHVVSQRMMTGTCASPLVQGSYSCYLIWTSFNFSHLAVGTILSLTLVALLTYSPIIRLWRINWYRLTIDRSILARIRGVVNWALSTNDRWWYSKHRFNMSTFETITFMRSESINGWFTHSDWIATASYARVEFITM